jgi:putative phosphoesterase
VPYSRKPRAESPRNSSAKNQASSTGKNPKNLAGNAPRKIGLISDTHGLLRKEALDALRGSDLIIHAGDVGDAKILEVLRRIAPVVAVRGNVDTAEWAKTLPETAVAEVGSVRIYVLHDSNALDLDAKTAGFDIVVSGHSHKPGRSERNGVMYINPGSAGPRRFRLPITVARLDLGVTPWRVEFVDLEQGLE